jgi:predicted nucleotidyltransferase
LKILKAEKVRLEMLFNFRQYLPKLVESTRKVLKDPEIYLFGSAIEGKLVGGSDIDIAIVGDVPRGQMERAAILAEIDEKANFPLNHPFEYLLLTKEEYKRWDEMYDIKKEKLS